jgi:hypothetical protein
VDTVKYPILVEDSIQEMLEDLLEAYTGTYGNYVMPHLMEISINQ